MGRAWFDTIGRSEDAEVVGLVDLDVEAASRMAAGDGTGHGQAPGDLVVGASLGEVVDKVSADAVLNVTIPEAHHGVTSEALLRGYPVLSEKPVARTVAEALSLAATSSLTGKLLMVSQSRRYFRTLATYKSALDLLGGVSLLSTEFFKAFRPGGFRTVMPSPLLVDMAIHPFDTARYLLDDDPVSVYCEEFNPPWSWYDGDAAASAVFTFAGGARFTFVGCWCSPGLETSWNGRWRASGADGSALWDGESSPTLELEGGADTLFAAGADRATPEEIAGSLVDFLHAIRTGEPPALRVEENIATLAMVEAAVQSSALAQRIRLSDIYDQALKQAIHDELRDDVRTALSTDFAVRYGAEAPSSPEVP